LKWFEVDKIPPNINPPDIEPMKAFVEYLRS